MMMSKHKTLAVGLAVSALALPFAAAAADSPHTLTGNVGIFSQYIFRGLTQTNEKPALQGGLDYSHSSGFYAGTWLSNISWFTDQNAGTLAAPVPLGSPGPVGAPYTPTGSNSASLEWDAYLGFKGAFAGDWSYDVGYLHYEYPGTYDNLGFFAKPNTNELYGAIGWKWVTAKYSHSLGDTFGMKDAEGTYYLDLSAAIPLGDSGFTLGLHAGKQKYKGTNTALWGASGCTNDCLSYTDYKISINKEYVGLNWGLAFTSTDADATHPVFGALYQNVYGKNIGRSQAVVSVQKTF